MPLRKLTSDSSGDDARQDAMGPAHQLADKFIIPANAESPWMLLLKRLLMALSLLFATAIIVYADRAGYSEELSFLDAFYYATVTLSTTGYGDITPVTDQARLVNIIVLTPLRIAFVVLLVGTTLSVLTERSRQAFTIERWRKKVRNHTVVIGYGTKGRSAVTAMLADGVDPSTIIVIDAEAKALKDCARLGILGLQGSGSRAETLRQAAVHKARAIIVAPNQDDTAVLVTLSVRELAPQATIVASVRESENQHLLLQSGADSVVVSAETTGRMLGLATRTPSVVEMMEDLLSPDEGFSIAERTVTEDEVGANPRHLDDIVLGVVRSQELYRIDAPECEVVEPGDRLLYVRRPGSA